MEDLERQLIDLPEPKPKPKPANKTFPHSRLLFLLFGLIIVFVTLFAFVAFVINSKAKPPEFHINSLSHQTPTNFTITFSVKNPNIFWHICYKHGGVWVFNDEGFVAKTYIKPFYQHPLDKRLVHANISTSGINNNNNNNNRYDAETNRDLVFDVLLQFNNVRIIKSWLFVKREASLLVDCNELRVEFPFNTSTGTIKSCKVLLLYGNSS